MSASRFFCWAVWLSAPLLTASSVAAGPAGRVAIVPDESRQMAGPLRSLLEDEGFRVTVVPWEDFVADRLSGDEIDLLVLADARRLPTTAVEASVALLHSRGKLIAIGAPAFGRLLIKTPGGYVSEEEYGDVLYGMLSGRPIPLTSAGWTRAAYNGQRAASIQLECGKGCSDARVAEVDEVGEMDPGRAWKVTMDLEGWDNFSQSVEDAFAGGHTLLCFKARGDANTPQLSIECAERDGSRWIATVPLSTEWRNYVLRPRDFGYWPDSPARRGGPGDRFNPANAAVLRFGLSGSHTPKCAPGLHRLWFQDVCTAANPNLDEPDLSVPDIEGLCPSYKLYPLADPVSLRPVHGLAVSALAQKRDGMTFIDPVPFCEKGYSPVWRAGGIGFGRGRPCRWVRVLDTYGPVGHNGGALVWLMLGETHFPGAIWASVGLADPMQMLSDTPHAKALRATLIRVAKAMTRGCFLLEAGSRHFSYRAGETVELGAVVTNAGREEARAIVVFHVVDSEGRRVFDATRSSTVPPGERREVTCDWTPDRDDVARFPCKVMTPLYLEPPDASARSPDESPIDEISHQIHLLPGRPGRPEEFVRVEGSGFVLGGKPWHLLGVNYRPTSQGGRPTLSMFQRDLYDPAVIERDLAWMESIGINTLSAIFAPVPPDPDAPRAYRDLEDFLERCRRHGMKVFYFLPWGNPLPKADVAAIKRHIQAAGLKAHPVILAWELAWEPIYHLGSASRSMDFLRPDWNAWLRQRYGSLAAAERDWGFTLKRIPAAGKPGREATGAELVALPDAQWSATHGPWDRAAAAFRRFFSDRVGRAYGDVIGEIRRFDPNHLVTFRFGACGIPGGPRFAHAHSASVAKHVSFLCPEGYNLQTGGWGQPTPADDLRQGGLVTLYYRFLSREKPVVWMEFGYTVNGFHTKWETGREHISPEELARQRAEYEGFYQMFLESGARGAAPWWLPGGFRVGEGSDFGILKPDGSERPVCEVVRRYQPKFAKVPDRSCVATGTGAAASQPGVITLDLDTHVADAWETYGPQYLAAVTSGRRPTLRTEGTGKTSADCPMVAVGNTPLNGHNPPKFLNAEFNAVEVKLAESAAWQEVRRGQMLKVRQGTEVRLRASVGNVAEATWLAPETGRPGEEGAVYLGCAVAPSGTAIQLPITADTPYLFDAEVAEFPLPLSAPGRQTVTLGMQTSRRAPGATAITIPFGEKRTVAVEISP